MFKGELTLHDIMYELPVKFLDGIKEARKEALLAEKRELDRLRGERESQSIRNTIMAP